jgi:perosamine synthetase
VVVVEAQLGLGKAGGWLVKNGAEVQAFEQAFAQYVGARYAIALCNGTATLHTALVALGVKPGDRVAVPPLTMASTTIAVLHAGAILAFCDVQEDTWLTLPFHPEGDPRYGIGVSLFGLHGPYIESSTVDDAAQTLRKHGGATFTSYSFQASKILALGEGGMLVTDDEALATRAREFSSLGYRMAPDQPRIDPAVLKSPTYSRHYSLGWNYRMNDLTAKRGLKLLEVADQLLAIRREAAFLYQSAIVGCEWLTQQYVPKRWTHDYWTYAVATDTPQRCLALLDAVAKRGERPYPAWRLTYQEPAFRHLALDGTCPVAESLQPRLIQFQTNDLASAARNAKALKRAIQEVR